MDRFSLGSITDPVGIGLELLGLLGLWFCCRRAAPRLAAVMLALLYAFNLFGVLQHGIFGPLGFALRHCGPDSGAVAQMFKLDALLTSNTTVGWIGIMGALIWIFLTLRGKASVPRWTVLLAPLITFRLEKIVFLVPTPLGLPLWDGWYNFVVALWFAVLALTYKEKEAESHDAVAALAHSERMRLKNNQNGGCHETSFIALDCNIAVFYRI